jgi:hypothetical protein
MKKTTTMMVAGLMAISITVSAQQTAPKSEVGQRQQNQRERINNGVKNGQITPAQAHALHQEDKSMHNEIKADRAQNGGKLTPGEKKQINQQQNQVSKQIHNEKHPNNPR